MRILIAGASGAIGRPLVRRLRANQHVVFALTRSPDSAPPLKEIGAEPVIADALDAAAVKAAVGRIRPDVVINQLTSLPRHYTPADMKAAAESRDWVSANTSCWLALRRRTSARPIAPLAPAMRILIPLPFSSLCGDSKRGQVNAQLQARNASSRPFCASHNRDQLPGRLEITCRKPWPGRRHRR